MIEYIEYIKVFLLIISLFYYIYYNNYTNNDIPNNNTNNNTNNDSNNNTNNDSNNNTNNDTNNNTNNDPFILCFRKTRIETLIMNCIEELSKKRDIQFVISFLNYKNDKAIKGTVYVITSKLVYKLFFIKNKLICSEYYIFNTFISKLNNNSYYSIKNYFNENKNSKEKTHHTEFYTWPYYYFTNNYDLESKNIDVFLKNF